MPAVQPLQTVDPGLPLKVPAAQLGHVEAPLTALAVPAAQFVQEVWPGASWNVPAPQLEQVA